MMQLTTLAYYVIPSVALLYATQLIAEYRRVLKSVGYFPGLRHIISPTTILANAFPRFISGVCVGQNYAWNAKHNEFDKYGSDIYTLVSVAPHPQAHIYVADAAALKEITSYRAKWVKPVEQYAMVLQFGRNIVATEGEEWKKHRKIANPAFSEPNNKLVWEEAVRITMDMINNVWKNEEEVIFDNAIEITLPLALLIIGSAGFGRKISFADDLKAPPGHKMSFKDALHVVSQDMILAVIFPRWVLSATARLARARDAIDELKKYMQEMIDDRRSLEQKPERYDLFSSLLDANLDEGDEGQARLTDSELTGDIFTFLLAGHETTAHTLCFTFGLLALYPDEQEILYKKIIEVLPNNRMPTYEDISALQYVLYVFYETLRLFPPVVTIPKKSAEDTTLVTTDLKTGEKIIIPVPKNAAVTLHTPGLHYNPRYWKDPYDFKPERFAGDWPRDAFLSFSGGARGCIGRRFSETEAVAILALIVSRYRMEVKNEPQFASETFEQRRERVLAARPGITLTPIRVPLVFKRR